MESNNLLDMERLVMNFLYESYESCNLPGRMNAKDVKNIIEHKTASMCKKERNRLISLLYKNVRLAYHGHNDPKHRFYKIVRSNVYQMLEERKKPAFGKANNNNEHNL